MRLNRILYISLFILSLLFLYTYGGKVPYMLFNTLLTMLAVSFLYALVVYLRFTCKQELDKKIVTKGDKVNFIFSVNNEDKFLYPFIKVTLYGDDTIFSHQFQTKCFSLAPGKEKAYSFQLECKYRGIYEMGIKSIEVGDLLGLFRLKYDYTENRYITVYPRIVPLERFRLKSSLLSETQTNLSSHNEDMAAISDIRDYILGDSIKKIHWKLTAKTGELLVKNFQSTSETSAVVILDLKQNPYNVEINTILEDKVIEAAVSVIYYCLSNWIPLNLVYFKDSLVNLEAKNLFDFEYIYTLLAQVSFSETVDVKDVLNVYLTENITRTNLIIITSNLNYDLFEEIYKSRFSGYEVILIYVSPGDLTGIENIEADNITAYLPKIGVDAYKININDDVGSVLSS